MSNDYYGNGLDKRENKIVLRCLRYILATALLSSTVAVFLTQNVSRKTQTNSVVNDSPVVEREQPPHSQYHSLPDDLRALQELTTGRNLDADNYANATDTSSFCPPPLKQWENRIVAPSKTTLHGIPRIIHLSERSTCLNRDMYDALLMWQKNFPSYSIFFHDDAAVDRLLLSNEGKWSNWREKFPDIVKILPCVSPGAMKIDIWRVLVLWEFGGFYSDVDVVPQKLTEETVHPNSTWFSLSDAWTRPSQWLFATSARHIACENTLHLIAEKVLDVGNIQKVKLVHITGPQTLYWGWKNAQPEDNAKPVNNTLPLLAPPAADQIKKDLVTFNDGSWGQKILNQNPWLDESYWGEKVPFEETFCVPRKTRAQKHFGRVHWTHSIPDLPPVSCMKHLQNLSQKEEEESEISANKMPFNSNISSFDLILRNSNNATMCAYLEKENVLEMEQEASKNNFCGSCKWAGKASCDDRVKYMISRYELSLQDAFKHVMENAGDKCKQNK